MYGSTMYEKPINRLLRHGYGMNVHIGGIFARATDNFVFQDN